MADSIKVAVRLRKLIQREVDQKLDCYWTLKDSCVCEKSDGRGDGHVYAFDRVYDQGVTTDVIYEELIAPILEDAMSGINGTVCAYGQTASGKTYTMLGTSDSPGIIPMCIADIYNTVENTPDREFLIRISYMEIYNENVVDLLGDVKKSLNVYDTVEGKVTIKDIAEEVVTSAKQIKAHLKKGEAARHYGSTNMNEKSSRSHTIFRVIIESRERVTNHRESFDGAVMVAHLNLVDLAGSEKAKQTGSTGQRLAEGGFINKSLSTLSQVISQLGNHSSFVSYRDSKLTRILQDSLGGNSKTAIICAVTPASLEETHSTLRFATSAKKITNTPIVNETISEEAMMRRMQKEIAELKKQLEKKSQEEGGMEKDCMQTVNQELKLKLAEKERLQCEQDEKIQRLMELISVSSRLKPSAEDDFRLKKKRRETWCPGKGRHSLAPKAFSKYSAGRTRELSSMVEEDGESGAEEEDRRLPDPFFCPKMITDDDFRSITRSVCAQTDPATAMATKGRSQKGSRIPLTRDTQLTNYSYTFDGAKVEIDDNSRKLSEKDDSFESLQQKMKDQDNAIAELQKSMSTMKHGHDEVVTAKDLEIAELKRAMSCVVTSECSECSSRLPVTTPKSPSMSCRNDDAPATDEMKRLEEELANKDLEIEALREALQESKERVKRVINIRRSFDYGELHQDRCQLDDKTAVLNVAGTTEEDAATAGTADCTLVSEEKRNILQQELAALKEQLVDSMSFSASLVEEISLLTTKLASSNESKKVVDEAYETLKQEFDELTEFTRFEKEFRDVSFMEKQEEAHRELIEQVISLEAQLKASKNREEMLKAVMQEQTSKISGEEDLAVEKEMSLARISDLERHVQELRCLEVEKDKLTEMNQELEEKLASLVEQQTLNTSKHTIEKVSQLEQEKCELVQQMKNLESQFNKHPDHLSSERLAVETQTEGEFEETSKKNVVEEQLQESEMAVAGLKEEVRQLTLQLENMSCKATETTDSEQTEALVEKIQSLEQQLDQSLFEQNQLKLKLEEQASLAIDAQNDFLELQDEVFNLKSQLEKREKQILELEEQLKQMTKSEKEAVFPESSGVGGGIGSIQPVDVAVKRNTGSIELLDERQAFVELQRKHEKVTAELKSVRDQLLLCGNKDLDVQKTRSSLEHVIRDMNAAVAQSNQENKVLVDQLNKDVYELSCKLQKTSCDLQLAQHRLAEAEKEKVQMKSEIQAAEGLLLRQESSCRKGPGDMDPEKLMERIKKLNVQIDLTNQRCQNYEAKAKTMEAAAQKFEAVQMERNSLQFQLREAQQQFRQTREEMVRIQQARSNSYTETAQMGLHVANLENKLQSLTNQKEAMQCDLEGREKERVAMVTESERISKELRQKEDELLVVKEQLSVVTRQKDDLQSRLEEIQSSRTTEMESLYAQLEERKKELSSLNQQLTTLICHKDNLETQLNAKEEEKLAASVDMERILSEHQQKEAELHAVTEQLAELTNEKVALETEQDGLRKDQSAMREKVERLTKERQQLDAEVVSIKEQLTVLQEVMKKEQGRELQKKTAEQEKSMEDRIEEVRKEERVQSTAVLEAKVEEMKRDAEEKRREEIMEIQQQAMEKLREISENLDAEKRQEIEGLQKRHTTELGEIEQKFSEEFRKLEESYQEGVANMKAENERLKLVAKGQVDDVEELRHRFEQDLREKESELSDMEGILTKKEIEIGELEQQLKELGQEMESIQRKPSDDGVSMALQQQQQLESLRTEHQRQMTTRTKELESTHADQLKSLERQHQEELTRMSAEHQAQVKECELRHSAAVGEALKKAELESERRIGELKDFYSEELRKAVDSVAKLKEESEKLSKCEKELADKTTHVLQLQELLDSAEQKRNETSEAVARLEAERRSSVSEKEHEVSELMETNSKLQKSVGCLKEQVELLEMERKQTCEAVARLEAERRSSVSEKDHEVSGLMETNSKLQKSVGCLKEQVELLEMELTSGEAEYKCSLARVEAQVTEVQQLLTERDDRVNLLEAEVERLECRLGAVSGQLREKVEALRKNTDELQLQSTEMAKLKQLMNEMRLEALSKQNLAVECESLRAKKSELDAQVQLVRERESEWKVKLTAAVDEATEAKKQCIEEINSLKLQLMETAQKERELKAKVEKLEIEKKKDKDEIDDLEKYCSEIVEELNRVKNFICDEQEKQRMEKHRVDSDAPRLRKERNELRVRVKSLESQVSGLNVECTTSRLEYDKLKQQMRNEIERLQKERDVSVEKELEAEKFEVARLRLKVNELETRFSTVTDALKAKLKSQALEIMRLESDAKGLKDEVKQLRTERAAVTSTAKVAAEASAAARSNNDLERMSVGTVSGGGIISDFNYYMTKAENEKMKRSNDNLQAQLASLKCKLESWKKENADLHQLIAEQDKKLAKYREQFAGTPGDAQRTAIAAINNSPDVAPKQSAEGQGQVSSPSIDIQKWIQGESNPYDASLLVKTIDEENCKTQ